MVGTEPRHTDAPSTEEELYGSIGALVVDAGLSPSLVLKQLRADVRKTPHSRRALTNFHRFLMTGFPSSWLRDFEEHHLLQQILLELFSQSQFLADILVRHPELFRWLTSTNLLNVTKTSDEYREEAAQAAGLFQRQEKKLDSLKRFQRRELLRIGARQILKEADVSTTSGELSALAEALIESVLDIAYAQVSETAQVGPQRELAVVGLGKLGGEELNFSSDIDLMFVYEKDGSLDANAGRLTTLHEYYVRVAEFVVRRLSEHTGEGHLYRVDMRLRPDGSSGPLAMSRSAYGAYYEARGESWERQMLIKARVVAGAREVGERWVDDLQPFIFPKTLLTSPLDEIARIKVKIESKIGEEENIKLGSGGIRDIEFSVQALQLLNGGANSALRHRGSVPAIRSLASSGHLGQREGKELEAAYHFLRTVEDRLQLLHGLQKHSLPESIEERTILARQLGFGTAGDFSRELGKQQSRIRSVYLSVFGERGTRKQGSPAVSLGSLLESRKLRAIGFLEPSDAGKRIHTMMDIIPELRQLARLRTFLGMVRKHGAPDWCLENLHLLSSSNPIRRSLQQVFSSDSALDLLTLLCSRSSKCAGVLAHEPLLFETMAGRPEDLLSRGTGWEFLKSADPVRFRTYSDFKEVVRFVVGESGVREFTAGLSQCAELMVKEAFDKATQEVPAAGGLSFSLLAMGKLGGGEISVGSDLDVVLLYKEGTRGSAETTAVAVGRRLRELLQGVYEVDFRLRPEGKYSPLATEYEYYKKYLAHRASLWERQALVKARVIAGDEGFAAEIAQTLSKFVFEAPLPVNWQKEILSMRQMMMREHTKKFGEANLKAGEGGLADLEFLSQSLQLRYGFTIPRIAQSNTFKAVSEIRKAKLLKGREALKVEQNLDFFRRLEAFIRINSETTDYRLPSDKIRLKVLSAAMGESSSAGLLKTVRMKRKENHSILTSVLKSRLR